MKDQVSRVSSGILLLALALLPAACDKSAKSTAGPTTSSSGTTAGRVRVGYTLHGLNDFTQVIQRGASGAGKALGADVDVQGPPRFSAPEAIAIFQGMTQRRYDGLVVVPMPGELWVTPIRQATEAGTPVLTANVPSVESAATAWFGQDERRSGEVLAAEMLKALAAKGVKKGKIVAGICAPGVDALLKRYDGFKHALEGTGFTLTEPYDVNTENTANYGAWENAVGANGGSVVAVVGLCSMDLPNLAKLKTRAKADWVLGGYDLNPDTLDAIEAGTVQVTIGQHPYLQGYLPVLAFVRHFRDKQPLPKGWVDVGSEVVTKENVKGVQGRETDPATEEKWYADYIAKNFGDLAAIAKPLPGKAP